MTGPTIGGTLITIEGAEFLDLLQVFLGGVAAEVQSTSSGRITALTPPGSAGPSVDLEILNQDGQSVVETEVFQYVLSSPQIFSSTPTAGPEDGGTALTIVGDDFLPGARVFVGSSEAMVVSVSAAGDEITAETSAGTPGPLVDIEVANPDGQIVTSTGVFQYNPRPRIANVRPRSAPRGGGTTVTIDGVHFQPGVRVFFDSLAAPRVDLLSPTEIEATTPSSGVARSVDLTVLNPDGGSDTVPGGFGFE